jgi:hypothetical protein
VAESLWIGSNSIGGYSTDLISTQCATYSADANGRGIGNKGHHGDAAV